MGCEILAKAALALSRSCPNLVLPTKESPFTAKADLS